MTHCESTDFERSAIRPSLPDEPRGGPPAGCAATVGPHDVHDIAIELEQAHPDVDVVNLRFTDLWKWVQALPDFDDAPQKSNEKILEAIQMAWLQERD